MDVFEGPAKNSRRVARKRDLIDKETKENKDIDEDESLQYVVGRVRGQHCELKVEK